MGGISEAWWEITGFKPNTPPMLSLKERRLIRKSTCNIMNSTSVSACSTAPSTGFDPASMIQVITATIASEIAKYKVEMKSAIHNEVQAAMAEAYTMVVQQTSLGQPSNMSDQLPSFHQPPISISADDEIMDAADIYEGYEEPKASIVPYEYDSPNKTKKYLESLLQKHFL